MAARKKIRLGDMLVENGVISAAQLDEALNAQKSSGLKLGNILIEHGYVAEDALLELLSTQLGIPFVDLSHYQFEPETIKKIPEIHAFARSGLQCEKFGLVLFQCRAFSLVPRLSLRHDVSSSGG